MSHSWGDNVFRAFMRWAAASDPEWVERHVASYINIAGPVLGVPKAITALLSGAQTPRFQPMCTTWSCGASDCVAASCRPERAVASLRVVSARLRLRAGRLCT